MDIAKDICTESFYTVNKRCPCNALTAVGGRHDICRNFYTSRFVNILKFTPQKCVIRDISDPEYWFLSISIHSIGIYTFIFSHYASYWVKLTIKFQEMFNEMWWIKSYSSAASDKYHAWKVGWIIFNEYSMNSIIFNGYNSYNSLLNIIVIFYLTHLCPIAVKKVDMVSKLSFVSTG